MGLNHLRSLPSCVMSSRVMREGLCVQESGLITAIFPIT